MKILIVAFLVVGIIFGNAHGANQKVYVVNGNVRENSTIAPTHRVESYASLLAHNLNLLQSVHTDELIQKHKGNQNVFHPLSIQNVFIFETTNSEAISKILKTVPTSSFELDVESGKSSFVLLEGLYGNGMSLANLSATRHGTSGQSSFLLFSDDAATVNKYQDSSLFVASANDDALALVIRKDLRSHQMTTGLLECLNSEFGRSYRFDLHKGSVTKLYSSGNGIQYTKEQAPAMEEFLRGVCSIAKLPRHFQIESRPIMLTVYLKGLASLEQTSSFTPEAMNFIYELFAFALRKVTNLLARSNLNFAIFLVRERSRQQIQTP